MELQPRVRVGTIWGTRARDEQGLEQTCQRQEICSRRTVTFGSPLLHHSVG